MSNSLQQTGRNFYRSLKLPIVWILVLAGVHVLQIIGIVNTSMWGLVPRSMYHIKGILSMPFLHSDWLHLLSNAFPLFVSVAIILFFYRRIAAMSIGLIYVLTGILLWGFGDFLFDDTLGVHIGASGIIYGFVSFIFWMGLFRRNFKSIALALVVLVLFQGMFAGISPSLEAERISWEGHLLGAIAGIIVAWLMRHRAAPVEEPVYSYELEQPQEEQFFLDRDTFEQTRKERQQRDSWTQNRTW